MPKKDGKSKLFSFDSETISQLEELTRYYKLKQTSLLEFLINKEFREIKQGRR